MRQFRQFSNTYQPKPQSLCRGSGFFRRLFLRIDNRTHSSYFIHPHAVTLDLSLSRMTVKGPQPKPPLSCAPPLSLRRQHTYAPCASVFRSIRPSNGLNHPLLHPICLLTQTLPLSFPLRPNRFSNPFRAFSFGRNRFFRAAPSCLSARQIRPPILSARSGAIRQKPHPPL